MKPGTRSRLAAAPLLSLIVVGCGGVTEPPGGQSGLGGGYDTCDLNHNYLVAGAARDGIPSLDDPVWSRADEALPDYVDPDTRVIGIHANGRAWAIPLNALWRHEIVNLATGGPNAPTLAITYCPLTGSSLVFDRSSVAGAELGVSGLLFMNNLVLYDRRSPDDTLWPQMIAGARCGSRRGAELTSFPFVEMHWSEWVDLNPTTVVLSGPADQGFDPIGFSYDAFRYPYDTYRESPFMFNQASFPEPDPRRFAKERVIGVRSRTEPPQGTPGIAFPFGALEDQPGDYLVAEFDIDSDAAVILWGDAAQGGAAFLPVTTGGTTVTLSATPTGFTDAETGSGWGLDGVAHSGALTGESLVILEQWHSSFWAPWAAFHPDTRLWEGPGSPS